MYKLFQKANHLADDILDIALKNRGIKNVEEYKNVNESSLIHYSKIKNIEAAVELYDKHNNEESHVIDIVDCDMDGYTSSAELLSYTRDNCKMNIKPLLHKGKKHGLSDEIMKELKDIHKERKIDLVILPDAGTSDISEHKALKDLGIDVLVLDHHDSDVYNEDYATVVNIQFSDDYENKQLSGAGVVYKFLQALDTKYGYDAADNALDLVAMGLVGDSMDVRNLETKHLINKGFENPENDLLSALAKKFTNGVKYLTANSFSFKAAPKLNATIRIGTQEQKMELLHAMMGETGSFTRHWRGKEIVESLAEKVVREATNNHRKQAKLKQKFLQEAIDKIEEDKLYNHRIIIVPIPYDEECKKLTGVLAADIVKKYKRPCLLVSFNSSINSYTGSARGDEKYVRNMKSFLNSTGLFVHCSGHEYAHGVELDKHNSIESVSKKLDELLEDEPLSNDVSVDFILNKSEVTEKMVKEVHSYEKYWGKGVDNITFAIENVKVDVNNINVTESGNMMKFYDGEIQYMKFPEDSNITSRKNEILTLNVIGTMSVSYFFGNVDHQVTINDYEIVSTDNKQTGFDFENLF